jgi:hypothetical protein
MVCLDPDKLTISKLDNMELREITETTRINITLVFKFMVSSNSKQEQNLNKNMK